MLQSMADSTVFMSYRHVQQWCIYDLQRGVEKLLLYAFSGSVYSVYLKSKAGNSNIYNMITG